MAVREAYRFGSDDRGVIQNPASAFRLERSRKSPTIFTGTRSLFAIVEGNPRWLIALASPLIRHFLEHPGQKVPRSVQANAILSACNRFRALLRTIPLFPWSDAPAHRISPGRGLLGLLDKIGEEFHSAVVKNAFSAEPALSFIVDSNAPEELIAALGRALNAGAIILVPEGGETLISSLRGKRFRLSYMLAPYYGIPLMLGRPISLSQVLSRESGEPSLLNWNQQ